MKTTIFTADDVAKIILHLGIDRVMDEAIQALYDAFAEYDESKFQIPIRSGFEYRQPDIGLIEWMPTMATNKQVVLKVVGYHPSNPSLRELPSVLSTVLNFDTATGHLDGLMDCTFLTAIRTGAASAVASRILAKKNANIIGLIACGAQAISQLHALSRIFSIEQVLIYDTDESTVNSFASRAASIGLSKLKITKAPLSEIVSKSHIICTTTSIDVGHGPVFDDCELYDGVHINAVGSDFPGKVEVPYSVLKNSLVCPDFREQAILEGECQQLDENDIGPDITELVKNEKKYEAYRDKATVFDSTGWAFEDYLMVNLLSAYGTKLAYGTEVQLACVGSDPKNPYSFAIENE